MKIAFFSAHRFEKNYFIEANQIGGHDIQFYDPALNQLTAPLAQGYDCVCCFVTDSLNKETLQILKNGGVRLIALRSAGYNNVDLEAANAMDLTVVRVPAYSPNAVAEYAVGLLLSLNRKIHKAYIRVHEQNFSLEGLVGFDLYQKTVGVIGAGKIGSVFATIMNGFGCSVLICDPKPNPELISKDFARLVSLDELYKKSDIISLHVPLLPETKHMIDARALAKMKRGVYLLNTGRGALIESHALIETLKSGHLGGAALDVYEEEEGIFFQDLSDQVLQDDLLIRLLSFPNVLLTSHQAFLTREALKKIASVTLQNISDFAAHRSLFNQVHAETHLIQNIEETISRN